jgi:uncharacterized repeat protein (TIGR03803 family)
MHGRKSTMILIATLIGLAGAFVANSQTANNERVLYSFSGGADGGQPLSELVFDAHGNLYGTTHDGGDFGDGTVFELTPASNGYWGEWSEKVLHSFHRDGKDGAHPTAGVVFDKEGNLWGTTENGGADLDPHFTNGGTVFELSLGPNGTWSETVFSFPHAYIQSGLIFDKAGNIYGTTRTDPRASGTGDGTVFKMARASNGKWTLTTLYAFRLENPYSGNPNWNDGSGPAAGLIFDAADNLYGTTPMGSGGTPLTDGTVFKLTRGSNGMWAETVLHNFNFRAGDAGGPRTDLIMDSHGNLYGTGGGGAFGVGSVFELSTGSNGKWAETILYNFNDKNDTTGDGLAPHCRLVFDKAGNLYGTTSGGGHGLGGTVFKLSPGQNGKWSMTVLHTFARDGTEGDASQAGLIFDAQGNLYGTTSRGGGDRNTPGHGAVFAILASSGPADSSDVQTAPPPARSNPVSSADSANVQTAPLSAPAPAMSNSANSPPAHQPADPLASIWQSASYAGQTFRFKLDGDAIYVYGEQQELLGTLQAKEKKGAIDMYQGLVQIAPVTQCPGGRGLMQIKSWNENRLDAKIETPVNGADGTTCGGVLGSGRLIPWQKVTFVKR